MAGHGDLGARMAQGLKASPILNREKHGAGGLCSSVIQKKQRKTHFFCFFVCDIRIKYYLCGIKQIVVTKITEYEM